MPSSAPGDMCACRPWPIDMSCCPTWPHETWAEVQNGTDRPLTADEASALSAWRMASSRLHRMTAFRWGLCDDLVRPCGRRTCCSPGRAGWGERGCGCRDDCSAGCSILLPGPVFDVVRVTVDGTELAEGADYFVSGAGALVRRDGCWPHTQDMGAACGEEGSFCVHYTRGINPGASPDAIKAASQLTCHLFETMCGTDCSVNIRGATKVKRGGVEYERSPDRRDTGVVATDDWLDLVNPRRIRQLPYVRSLDLPKWQFRGVSEFRRAVGGR